MLTANEIREMGYMSAGYVGEHEVFCAPSQEEGQFLYFLVDKSGKSTSRYSKLLSENEVSIGIACCKLLSS